MSVFVFSTFRGHTEGVTCLALTVDKLKVLSGSIDASIRLWDLETAKQRAIFMGHNRAVAGLAVTHDGRSFVSGSHDHTLKLWSIEDPLKPLFTCIGHTGGITCLVIAADDTKIYSASADESIRVWSTATGQQLKIFPLQEALISSLALHGDQLIGAVSIGHVCIWNADTTQLISKVFDYPNGGISHMSTSADGAFLLCGFADGAARLIDVKACQNEALWKQVAIVCVCVRVCVCVCVCVCECV